MIGQTISHYLILEKIGEGGMGVVYKAQDLKLNRTVALKFMPGEAQLNEEIRQRFLQEAQSAALLNHPNICTIHDIRDEEGQRFIVMEFVDGQTLRKKIYGSAGQKLDETAALGLAVQVGDALAEAHRHGIVHRDIKADNIMVNARAQAKVMDFGLAKLKGSMKITRDSSTIGTLAYMAPEQLRAEEADTRSDIFSYGVLLFEMLTGRMPFRGEHEAAVMYTIMNEPPEPVSKFAPEVSPDLERIIGRALEKDPADRYQHIDDLVSELRRIQKKSGKIGMPASGADLRVPEFARQGPGTVSAGTAPRHPETAQPAPGAGPPAPGLRDVAERTGRKRWPIFAGAGLAVAAAVILAYVLLFPDGSRRIDSLAVLPFVNANGDPEIEYLTEGVTDYLTNKLAQVPGLRVLPSSFVAKYRNREIQPNQIGAELGVGAILAGRVVHRDGKLTVQAELIDVANVSQLWGERYEREVTGIQEMQGEIVSKVSDRLGITLGSKETANLVKGSTKNTAAYQLYLKGRYQWNKRTADGARAALQYFQQAVDADPMFALAYVGYAQAVLFPGSEDAPAKVRIPKIKAAAERALEIEEELAEAHVALAAYYGHWERDWTKAGEEYRRALELDPKYPTGLHWNAEYFCLTGRFDEGLAMYREAVAADPLSLAIGTDAGWGYYFAREYDSAAAVLENILRTDPEYERTYDYLVPVYIAIGRPEKVYGILRERAMRIGGNAGTPAAVDSAWKAGGLNGVARLRLREYQAEEGSTDPPYILMAELYTVMGMKDTALALIRKGFENHDIWCINLGTKPIYDPLRGDPAFEEIIEKMGFREAEALALARAAR